MGSVSNPGNIPVVYAVRTDQTVNNSETLVSLSDTLVEMVNGGVYEFDAWLFYNTGAVPDLKVGWAVPSGSLGRYHYVGPAVSGDNVPLATAVDIPGAVADEMVRLIGAIKCSGGAGALLLRFAQNTADVSNTTIYAGSYLKCRRVG